MSTLDTDWTPARVVATFDRPSNIDRAVLALYREQTADEQADQWTRHVNGRGFNATDAPFLSSLAQWIEKRGSLTVNQRAAALRRVRKYSRQLADLANAAQAHRDAAVTPSVRTLA
jgi:hypothetical protein